MKDEIQHESVLLLDKWIYHILKAQDSFCVDFNLAKINVM